MKRLTLTLFIICGIAPLLKAQSFELSVGANTGWFAYNGPGATASTAMFIGTNQSTSDVLNSYGSKYAFSYGAFLQPQFVFKSNLILGLQAGYDILRSKDAISVVYLYEAYYLPNYYGTPPPEPASGSDIMQTQVININPYIGYRIKAGNIKIDVMPGMSFGLDLTSREKGKAEWGDTSSMQTNNKQPTQHADVQLKLGIGASWQRWGLVASYAYGLTDLEPIHEIVPMASGGYQSTGDYYGPDEKIHSRLFRVGISYRLFTGK